MEPVTLTAIVSAIATILLTKPLYFRADEIVAQIVKWGFGSFYTKKQKLVQFFDEI
ncbi:hypothetical protein [Fischerella sp. JS2]|uniref:hypothetical protein n=1 Tax=Fischerella sp. JS2 TaxID=2597771 RepID=UPI0028EA6796|nr:hypothetical protein [Fischerella sp. JS2]